MKQANAGVFARLGDVQWAPTFAARIEKETLAALSIIGCGLAALCFGCDESPGGQGKTDQSQRDDQGIADHGDQDIDTGPSNNPADSLPGEDSDPDTSSEGDVDSDSSDLASAPQPATPCADDLDADLHHEAEVNHVTGTVVPDLGQMPEPQMFSGDPADDGPFRVAQVNVTIPIQGRQFEAAGYQFSLKPGQLSGTVFAPSDDGDTSASGPFPLVLVLSGFNDSYTSYTMYARHFASHGFLVLGFDTRSSRFSPSHDTEMAEVISVIDWVLDDSSFAHLIDPTKIAVCGASKGGKVAFFAAAVDSRIDLVIGWDPSNSGGPPCFLPLPIDCNQFPVAPNCAIEHSGLLHLIRAETLILGSPRDPLANPDRHHNSIHFYRGAPSPSSLVYFDAGHNGCKNAPANIRINQQVQVALLLHRFKGMVGLESYLPNNAVGAQNLLSQRIVLRVESK